MAVPGFVVLALLQDIGFVVHICWLIFHISALLHVWHG